MGERAITLHFRAFPEDHLWVGECIELDIASGGESEAEALRNAIEATQLHLDVLAEHGEIDEFLHERGMGRTQRIEERTILVAAPATA